MNTAVWAGAISATLPEPKPADPDEFIPGLRAGLLPEAAEQAIAIYLGATRNAE